jgi:hypothetical protein
MELDTEKVSVKHWDASDMVFPPMFLRTLTDLVPML